MLDTCLLDSQAQFLHQDIHDGELQRSRQVFLVMFHEIGVFLHPVTQIVEEGGLESAETVIKTGNIRFGKFIGLGISLTGQFVYDGTTRIAQAHHLRTLVDSLSGCIVDGLAKHFHIIIGIHLHNLGVASTHQQTKERERRLCVIVISLLDEMGHHMTLQMVDINHGNTQRTGKSLGKTDSHQQRTHQSGTTGEGYG